MARISHRIRRCAYCRHEVVGEGFPHDGILYCSRACREIGVFNKAQRETVQSPWYIVLAAIATLLTMALTSYLMPALAHDMYGNWVNGINGGSCCNGKKTEDGMETGDCEPTAAKFERGNWWAYVKSTKIWVQIPDEKIVHYKTHDLNAHLCYSEVWKEVYCFRPPPTGM